MIISAFQSIPSAPYICLYTLTTDLECLTLIRRSQRRRIFVEFSLFPWLWGRAAYRRVNRVFFLVFGGFRFAWTELNVDATWLAVDSITIQSAKNLCGARWCRSETRSIPSRRRSGIKTRWGFIVGDSDNFIAWHNNLSYIKIVCMNYIWIYIFRCLYIYIYRGYIFTLYIYMYKCRYVVGVVACCGL